jgi:hypothetical protein
MAWSEHLRNVQEQERADLWRSFHNRFMKLAYEEQRRAEVITKGRVLQGMDQVLRATCNYKNHPEGWERGKPEQGLICLLDTPPYGVWHYANRGISENFYERVRLCVAEAGRALPDCPNDAEPEDFWLHRLYLDLLKNESDLLFSASEEGGMILSVCVASATFCARLERQGIGKRESGKLPEQQQDTGADFLKTSANQKEGSRVENNEGTTGGFSPSQDYRSVSIHGKNFTLTSRQAQVIQILDEHRKEGHPDVGQDYILEQLGSPNSRLSDTFKSNRIAWKTLVISGKKRGTKRLSM